MSFEILTALSSTATAVGVFFAWSQIRASRKQNRTQFEDSLAREYRELAHRFPVKALLGEELTKDEFEQNFHLFYHYVDLSNEQAFLYAQNRISSATWKNWIEGIQANMSLPAIRKAWEEIRLKSPSRFQELRELDDRKSSPSLINCSHSHAGLIESR